MKALLLKKESKIVSKLIYERIRDYDMDIKSTIERIESGIYDKDLNKKHLISTQKKRNDLVNIYQKF
jgi:hypothetical protein